jgi:hypothetical protein
MDGSSLGQKMALCDYGTSGMPQVTLSGHSGKVAGALLHNHQILSWSDDTTLRLWDLRSGDPLTLCAGHTGPVRQALIVGNGRIVSWSPYEILLRRQGTGSPAVLLREPEQDSITFSKADHRRPQVGGVFVLPDGRLVSWIGRYPFVHIANDT